MKTTGMMVAGLVFTLAGTGCATKKYVAKTVAPVEQRVSGVENRVSGVENKDTEQDKTTAMQGTQIEGIDRDLSQTQGKIGRRRRQGNSGG